MAESTCPTCGGPKPSRPAAECRSCYFKGRRRDTLLERLADKFTIGDGCWEWTASRSSVGYGTVWNARIGQGDNAHRVVYELLVGPIPEGLELDHLCRNRPCVRPDHLEPVTPSENVLRSDVPKRERQKTHCPKGHPYDDENTFYARKPSGRLSRGCRECRRLYHRELRKRKKAMTDG